MGLLIHSIFFFFKGFISMAYGLRRRLKQRRQHIMQSWDWRETRHNKKTETWHLARVNGERASGGGRVPRPHHLVPRPHHVRRMQQGCSCSCAHVSHGHSLLGEDVIVRSEEGFLVEHIQQHEDSEVAMLCRCDVHVMLHHLRFTQPEVCLPT